MRPAASESGFAPSIDDLVFVYDKVGLPEGRLRRDTASHNQKRCSCGEGTKRQRRNTLPVSKGGIFHSADIPLRGSTLDFQRDSLCAIRNLRNLSRIIRRMPEPLRIILPFICAPCFLIAYGSWVEGVLSSSAGSSINPRSLNPNCIVCDVVQQIHRSTFVGSESAEPIRLRYEHSIQKGRHMQIDLDCGGGIKTRVQLYTEGHDPYNPFPVSLSTVCSESLSSPMAKKIKRWIADCTRDHERCLGSVTNAVFVPKRLIHLEGDCRLESPRVPVEYAALSYCWGSVTPSATTKSNLTLRYSNLPYEKLALTLQDAITMTRMLGLKYLWIDSVCIVQDDKEDWAAEAANMGKIYSEAHVVLAATAGSSASYGLRQQRGQVRRVRSLVDPHHPIEVIARIVNNHAASGGVVKIEDQPLSKRGWALQERVLARRTVHFLPDEVLFECRSDITCECGYVQICPHKPKSLASFPDEETSRSHRELKRETSNIWTLFVEDFTMRSLTFQKDALPALSGIAKRMLILEPGRYFAGIWEQGIAYQLQWVHASLIDPVRFGMTINYEKKIPQHRPTFSWVTCPGPVKFSDDVGEPICNFVTGGSTPCEGDVYGQVKDVFIQINGRSILGRELISGIENIGAEVPSYFWPEVYLDTMQYFSTDKHRDIPEKEAYEGLGSACDWSSVVCLGLCAVRLGLKSHCDRLSMLLLKAIPEEDIYVRIGVVAWFPLSYFDEFSIERTVTIV